MCVADVTCTMMLLIAIVLKSARMQLLEAVMSTVIVAIRASISSTVTTSDDAGIAQHVPFTTML